MNLVRNKNKPGLIYNSDPINCFPRNLNQFNSNQKSRPRPGSITGLTPKRNSSIGKIITRPITSMSSRKSTLSIEIQTMEIIPVMESKAIQVESMLLHKFDVKQIKSEKSVKDGKSRGGVLKIADLNILDEGEGLNLTLRKNYEINKNNEGKENRMQRKQQTKTKKVTIIEPHESGVDTVKRSGSNNQKGQALHSIMIKGGSTKEESVKKGVIEENKLTRQQKISKLSALYQKNLAKYETSKSTLEQLLKQTKNK